MGDVGHTEEWPLIGTLAPGSTRSMLILDKVSKYSHTGMIVHIEVPGGENVSVEVSRLQPMRPEVYLAEELPFDPAGLRFQTKASLPPEDLTQWLPTHVLTAIEYFYVDTTNVKSKQWQYDALSEAGIVLDEDSSIDDLDAAWVGTRAWLENLKQRGLVLGVIGRATEEQLARFDKLQHVIMVFCHVYEVLYADKQLSRAIISGGANTTDTYTNPWWYSHDTNTEGSDLFELTEFFLAQSYRQRLKKRDDIVFEQVNAESDVWNPPEDNPICTRRGCARLAVYGYPGGERTLCEHDGTAHSGMLDLRRDANGKIHPRETVRMVFGTQAWRPMMQGNNKPVTIADWMHRVLTRTTHRDLYVKWVSNYSTNFRACEALLRRTHDESFPVYNPNPMYFSFKNGIFNIRDSKFYEYGSKLPSVCSLNYINQLFNPRWATLPLNHPEMQVQGYVQILTSQGYDDEMIKWLDTFQGRLFFPVNDLDRWEKLLVIKGWAATGKSTLAKGIGALFGEVNVGYIPANCEEQWALASVHQKRLWMCLELKSGFRLPTGVMQSMVSGERVVVHEKFKTAFDLMWSIQGMLVGNELPLSWTQDVMNALVRRVVPFPFDFPPDVQDPSIGPSFMRDLGRFLARITRQYIATVEEVGDRNVDEFLPARLKQASADFEERALPLVRFIQNSEDIEEATTKEKTAILIELMDKHGIKGKVLGLTVPRVEEFKAQIEGRAGNDSTIATESGAMLLEKFHMSMSEVQARYKTWCDMTNGRRGQTSISNSEAYRPAAKKMNLAVVRNVTIGNGQRLKGEHWFGIRLVNDARSSGPLDE